MVLIYTFLLKLHFKTVIIPLAPPIYTFLQEVYFQAEVVLTTIYTFLGEFHFLTELVLIPI